MKRFFIFLLLTIAMASTTSAASISIDTDEDDCVNGWISMDVTTTVDGETFSFNPSCNFSFDQTFTTSKGINCRIEAGMCSGFLPFNKIQVSCEGASESAPVKCPKKP